MIFFRARTIQNKIKKGDQTILFFVKLKAFFSGPVDKLSGMVVNLQDVDQWMDQALAQAPVSTSLNESLSSFYSSLKKLSSSLEKVEISFGSQGVEFNGSRFLWTYAAQTWFYQDQSLVQRSIQLQTSKPLSKKWRTTLSQKRWSSPQALGQSLKKIGPQFRTLEVQLVESKAWEKFQL